jgi:hypothetical protein
LLGESGRARAAHSGSSRICHLRAVHRAHVFLALAEQEAEQRLRAVAGELGSVYLRSYEPPDGEEIGPLMRVFGQFPEGFLGSADYRRGEDWTVLLLSGSHRCELRLATAVHIVELVGSVVVPAWTAIELVVLPDS